jgi:hypothetical protein
MFALLNTRTQLLGISEVPEATATRHHPHANESHVSTRHGKSSLRERHAEPPYSCRADTALVCESQADAWPSRRSTADPSQRRRALLGNAPTSHIDGNMRYF